MDNLPSKTHIRCILSKDKSEVDFNSGVDTNAAGEFAIFCPTPTSLFCSS